MKLRTTIIASALAMVFAAPALGADKKPYTRPDDSWISLSGKVTTVGPDAFLLDYGSGRINVEFDDYGPSGEAYVLKTGDQVTVTGRIDDDLFETRSIEASSVYVENINAYFYASAADEEDAWAAISTPYATSTTFVRGTVTAVDGREFTVDTGPGRIRVDTSNLPYNPMDDIGFTQIDVGDRVSLSGKLDIDLFETRELMATSVVELVGSTDAEIAAR